MRGFGECAHSRCSAPSCIGGPKEPQLDALLRIRDEEESPLVLSAPVAAEVDYLLGVRFGEAARRAFLSDLAARRYDVACLEAG
jgi:hypothetical protein